jgi:hypothetical protein
MKTRLIPAQRSKDLATLPAREENLQHSNLREAHPRKQAVKTPRADSRVKGSPQQAAPDPNRRPEMQTDVKSGDRRIRACTLVEKHADEIRVLFAEGLNVINEALEAERVVLDREGEPLNIGPDYAIRTAATRLLNELCLRCRKAPVEEREKAPPMTIERLTQIMEESKAERLKTESEDTLAATKRGRQCESESPNQEGGNRNVRS